MPRKAAPPAKRKTGRPTLATPELKQRIAEKIAAGEYIHDFAGKGGFPAARTITDWQLADDEFRLLCARAREASAVHNEQAVADLVADVTARKIEPDAARVALNGLTWLAKVRAPRVYGDKVEHEHSGGVALTIASSDAAL